MADPTIEVDDGVLADKTRELERIRAGLAAWREGTRVTGMFDAVGDPSLADQLRGFHDGWHDGVDEIEGNLDGAIGLLKAAVEQYRAADQSAGDAAAKMMGG